MLEQYICELHACYGGEHVLLLRLPGLVRGVEGLELRRLLKQCQRWTVLRLSRILPLVDAHGPDTVPESPGIAHLFAQARAILNDEALMPREKDARILTILQQIHADQRREYVSLQKAAHHQGNAPAAQLSRTLGNELAEVSRRLAAFAQGQPPGVTAEHRV